MENTGTPKTWADYEADADAAMSGLSEAIAETCDLLDAIVDVLVGEPS
jgi:hypothetical protein